MAKQYAYNTEQSKILIHGGIEMTAFLVIVLIIGNLLLLSGSMFGDLSDNGIAWLIVIAAIGMDCYFIYKILQGISEGNEKKRASEATQKVNKILEQYSPNKEISLMTVQPPKVEIALVNKEIVFMVQQYKNNLSDIISKCNEIDKSIKSILSCIGCSNIVEKLNYLTSKTNELQHLKVESDLLHREVENHKIKLINEDVDLLFLVKKSLTTLLLSKKCVIDGLSIKEIICEEKPADLDLFDYKYPPAILRLGKYYYCLFSNVILVFDTNGIFATAIDPTALTIIIERVQVDIWISNNTLPSHQYIDIDSKCVEQGQTRRTWMHTCRDGSPDLRYSYNPSIEYRTDKYEYGKIAISVLDSKVQFSLSSDVATNSLERLSNEYIKRHNNRHNPVPEFLNLLCKASDEGDANIAYILEMMKSHTTTTNYFCVMS